MAAIELGNHSTFVATLVVQLIASAVLGAGLTFYFAYDASNNYWEVPILWGVAILALITTTLLIAGSAAKSVFCLTLMPGISILNVILEILCIVASILMLRANIRTLHFCNSPVTLDRSDCVFLFDSKFCGPDISMECKSLKHGFLLIIIALAMLTVVQFVSFLAAFQRRSNVIKRAFEDEDDSYDNGY
eukprot:Phypoly_transcript_18955.p1 GENE.Phypoly_transcript_18955~~Phypoly_transcript_18955.p1  ORF type:complete len:189 (+),score=9.75 Phypoly_transcript_18955:147-713(+)